MLSNKLTFSLASLVVLLIAALCFPVAAQTGGLVNLNPSTALTIPAGGHGVLGRVAATPAGVVDDTAYQPLPTTTAPAINLPDLAAFLAIGGTLELIITSHVPGATADDPAVAIDLDHSAGTRNVTAKDLVISEIMWGHDNSGRNADNSADVSADARQWIEIYNTTEFDITIGGTAASAADAATAAVVNAQLQVTYHTTVTDDPPTNTIVSDTVSNVYLGKWMMPGSSGVIVSPLGKQNAPAQSNLVSAYRNINYAAVTGTHGDAVRLDNTVDQTIRRTKQLEGIPNGSLSNSWKATPVAGSRNMMRWYIGTPGEMHISDKNFTFVIAPTMVPSDSVVINEVSVGGDWVELYNAGTEAVGLWGWELSIIAGDDAAKTDKMLVGRDEEHRTDAQKREFSFPKNEDFKLQPGEYLLIVKEHPSETSLANGVNVEEVLAGKDVKAGASHQYIVRSRLDLPAENFTLLLRDHVEKNAQHKDPKKAQHAAEFATTNTTPSSNIKDYAGNHRIAVGESEYNTTFWPFRGWDSLTPATGKDGNNNRFPSGNAWSRTKTGEATGHHKGAWVENGVGFKGGIGYDAGVKGVGTPGYANDNLRTQLVDDKNTAATTDDVLFSGAISISEVMVDAGPRWNLVQWIELYNSSMTEVVNVAGWELEIRNATDDVESYVDSGFMFNDAYIRPNQTLLLVSGTGTNDVIDNRVYNLYQHHRRDLGLTNRRSVLLSPGGFYLKLTDKNGDMVDEAGNVMVDGAERNIQWELPTRSPDMRQSLVRQYGTRELYDGTPDMADDGTMMESWRQSDLTGAGISFYGHRDDISTPGFRLGGPLPVSLSKFRPVRNQDTGHVDIQWITESELNNAGFNILRSETKTGEFKVINVKGIVAGHGTTSEKHVYTFTDTTAKPNVVYYYQIEDVSVNGLRTTLTTTHLRGHVGAAGKLTTRWGELKTSK